MFDTIANPLSEAADARTAAVRAARFAVDLALDSDRLRRARLARVAIGDPGLSTVSLAMAGHGRTERSTTDAQWSCAGLGT